MSDTSLYRGLNIELGITIDDEEAAEAIVDYCRSLQSEHEHVTFCGDYVMGMRYETISKHVFAIERNGARNKAMNKVAKGLGVDFTNARSYAETQGYSDDSGNAVVSDEDAFAAFRVALKRHILLAAVWQWRQAQVVAKAGEAANL